MKLRVYLAIGAIAVLVPFVVFSAVALNMLLDAERAAVLKNITETTRAAALSVDRELARAAASMRVLATSPSLSSGNLHEFYLQATVANGETEAWTALTDASGQLLINTIAPFGQQLPPFQQVRVHDMLEGHTTIVSNLVLGPITHRHVIAVSVPFTVKNKPLVLSQIFPASYFNHAFERPDVPSTWIFGIVDREGTLIARSHAADKYVGKKTIPELLDTPRSSLEGIVRTRSLDGSDVYAVYTRSRESGWTVAIGVPVQDVEGAAQRAVRVVALGLLAALACALGAAALFGRYLVRAIAAAAQAATALGQGREITAGRSLVTEIGELNTALVQANRRLAEAALERARLFRHEQEARQAAESDSKAKTQFLAMLGHELRNPLTAIAGAIDLMQMVGVAAQTAGRAQAIIARQSRHLARIVDDLLEAGRMSAGRIALHPQSGDLASAVRSSVAALEIGGRLQAHRLTVHAAPVRVHADWTRVDQMITNLLVNAVKYTAPGGDIELRVYRDGSDAVLTVRDTGIGIDADLLPRIFDVFVQGPVSLDRSQGGLGIGLTLVRELAALHGGTIHAASEGAGCGSLFTLRLPAEAEGGEIEDAAKGDRV